MTEEYAFIGREELRERIEDLGRQIIRDYQGKDPVCIGLLRGGFIFLAGLIREIPLGMDVDSTRTASYGHGKRFSGIVEVLDRHKVDIRGKGILLVNDIIDSGRTISTVVGLLKEKEPASIKTCLMLDKPSRREVGLTPDYVVFKTPDVFIVGCGLSYEDCRRSIPCIYTYND